MLSKIYKIRADCHSNLVFMLDAEREREEFEGADENFHGAEFCERTSISPEGGFVKTLHPVMLLFRFITNFLKLSMFARTEALSSNT